MNYNSNLYVHQSIITVQGEGDLLGVPSLLLRLAGCNCRCPWCDTAWSWSEKGAEVIDRTNFDDWLASLMEQCDKTVGNLMITGGEPLLYKNNKLFKKLLECDYFDSIEIETNGSLLDKEFIESLSTRVKLNISPKLDVTWYTEDSEGKFHDIVINRKHIIKHGNFIFKFVDDPEYSHITDEFIVSMGLEKGYIYLMPLTPKRNKYPDKEEFMAKVKESSIRTLKHCIEFGYNFVPRLHLYLFDDENETI